MIFNITFFIIIIKKILLLILNILLYIYIYIYFKINSDLNNNNIAEIPEFLNSLSNLQYM